MGALQTGRGACLSHINQGRGQPSGAVMDGHIMFGTSDGIPKHRMHVMHTFAIHIPAALQVEERSCYVNSKGATAAYGA
jgi:hypothetical protein